MEKFVLFPFLQRRERDLAVVSTTIASEMFVKNPSTVLVLAMAGRPHFVVIGFRSSMTAKGVSPIV